MEKTVMDELRGMPGPESDLDLAHLLMNPDPQVVKLAAHRIGLIRDTRNVKDLIRCIAKVRERNTEGDAIVDEGRTSLKLIGEGAFDPLVELTEDEDEEVRCTAIECLGVIGCARAVGPLCAALDTPQPWIKISALQGLVWLGIVTDDVENHILSCLYDNHKGVQHKAVEACGELGLQRAVPALITGLDPKNISLQHVIIPALGKIRDPRAVDRLVALLDSVTGDRSPFNPLIGSLTEALGSIADPRAVQSLIRALIYCINDDSQDGDSVDGCSPLVVVGTIHKALTRIGAPALPSLIGTLREWADRLGDVEDCAEYSGCCSLSVAGEISLIIYDIGPPGVEAVLPLTRDEKVSVRKMAVSFFSEEHLVDQRVMDALISCLMNDPDERVRILAAHSLSCGGERSCEAIVSAVNQLHRPFTGAEAKAIRLIAMRALSDITRCLEAPDQEMRRESLDAIRKMLESSPHTSGMEGLAALFG